MIRTGKEKWHNDPGELVYSGRNKNQKTTIDIFTYDEEKNLIEESSDLSKLDKTKDLVWIDIFGLTEKNILLEVGKKYNLNEMVLEDVMNQCESVKVEFYDEYIFVLMKNLILKKDMSAVPQQISFVLYKDNTLITFRDDKFKIIEKVKEEFLLLGKKDADYILYYIMDKIVDNYFVMLSDVENHIEEIEGDVLTEKGDINVEYVYKIRKELLQLRTSIWPLDNITHEIIRDYEFVDETTKEYFKDLNGNIVQLTNYIAIYRESIIGLFDIYLSNTSNKMNKIMQTLTIVSIIFIPSTFLAGVYGMNFTNFPILNYEYAYPLFWVVNIALMVGILVYFKNKKWI